MLSYILGWLATLILLSFLMLPLAEKFKYPIAISLILLPYIVWLFANFIEFEVAVKLGFISYLALSLLLFLFNRPKLTTLIEFAKSILIFTLFYLLYTIYVLFNPYIYGGEKLMDIGVLNGILKSDRLPPIDVNLAGFRFDFYYYLGYLIVATLTVLTQIPPQIAYNLALATFFALTLTLVTQSKYKFLPFLLLAGNLASFIFILEGQIDKAFNFWDVTRIVPNTINEFPFATFTFRDLHPHLMSIPFQVLFIILFLKYLKERDAITFGFLSFLLGFMLTINSWEITYLALLILFSKPIHLLLLPLTIIPFLPYYLNLNPSTVHGIGIVEMRTSLHHFIMAQPLILIPFVYSFVRNRKLATLTFLISIFLAIILHFPTLLILLPILVVEIFNKRKNPITILAVLVLLATEIVFLDDPYPAKYDRLNTVFKLYMQAWILLSFSSAMILHDLADIMKNKSKIKNNNNINIKLAKIGIVMCVIFIAILWIYPIGFLTTLKYKGTIDGMEFTKQYGEYNALKFLQKLKGVILEYPGDKPFESYTYAGRVSAFTGLQSVISRSGHELFWRYFNNTTIPILYERWKDANKIYSAKNLSNVLDLIKKYNIRYIYVGYLEKAHYSGESLKKFKALKIIYQDNNVTVYEVNIN